MNKIYEKYVKRVLDIIISIVSLIISIPFFIVFSIIIKKQSIGPVFFKQQRIGKNGKIIKIIKFRTMVHDAEKLKENFTLEQKKEYEENFKLRNDYRVTRFGKLLRRTGLDELPQFINVIKGDLSVIGPRPVVEDEIIKYGDHKNKVFSRRPGITGLWVANKKENTTYEERIKMDLYYNENINFILDCKILFKTLKNMVINIWGDK